MNKTVLLLITASLLFSSCSISKQNTGNTTLPKTKENKMENQNYTSTILVDKSKAEAFDNIKNFRAWWSEDIAGETDKPGETFFYHYKEVHLCKMKLIEMIPDQKLVYQVVANEFSFTKDKTEWVNTKLVFDISAEGKQTKVKFTHEGLVPAW